MRHPGRSVGIRAHRRRAARPTDSYRGIDPASSCEVCRPGLGRLDGVALAVGVPVAGGDGRLGGESLLLPVVGDPDLDLRLLAADPVRALDALAGLEVLVDLEEVLDLQLLEDVQIADVLQVRLPRVVGRHAQHLVVRARPRPSSGTCRSPARSPGSPGRSASASSTSASSGSPSWPEGVVDEAVVGRVLGRGEQRPVEPDSARVVVHLVFVPTALRDLDGHVELHECHLSRHASAVGRRPKHPDPAGTTGTIRGRPGSVARLGPGQTLVWTGSTGLAVRAGSSWRPSTSCRRSWLGGRRRRCRPGSRSHR